ncbi:MAG: FmdB family zinc ribbon protein [Thermoanaerobaculia bacterium]
MPIYEYQCAACGERLERLQKLGDPPPVACPACGARRLERLVSSPAFQFKGSGWYVTDYARQGADKGKGKEKEGAEAKSGDDSKAGASEADKKDKNEKKKEKKKEATAPKPAES